MRAARPLLAVLWLAAFGCSEDVYGVAVTLRAGTSLTDERLAAVRAIDVRGAGAESGEQKIAVPAFSPAREERFLYRPNVAGGDITLTVELLDFEGQSVAIGQGAVTLSPGHTVPLTIPLGDELPDLAGSPSGPVLTPATATVGRNGTIAFSADRAVTFAVVEPSGGTIDASGHYQAPAFPGIYHVTATLPGAPPQAASATVTVGYNHVTALAGAVGGSGNLDGVGNQARFNFSSTAGFVIANAAGTTLYATDRSSHTIRKVDIATARVSTVAGVPGVAGARDTGAQPTDPPAAFDNPAGLALSPDGNTLYVSDLVNHAIRKIDLKTATPTVTTLAGQLGKSGYVDSANAADVRFRGPTGLALDAVRNLLYVADYGDNRVRSVSTLTGATTTLAGNGVAASVDSGSGPASFNHPEGVEYDGLALYVSDGQSSVVRKVTVPGGVVSTIAGTVGMFGNTDGNLSTARLDRPIGLTSVGDSSSGSLLVSDVDNHNLRLIDKGTLAVTTLAGPTGSGGQFGWVDGAPAGARFSVPRSTALAGGNAYIVDQNNNALRLITGAFGASPVVSTFAGLPLQAGASDGAGSAARFDLVWSVQAVGADLFAADFNNHAVRRVVLSSPATVTTFAGSRASQGTADGIGAAAQFITPTAFAFDGDHLLYLADYNASNIRSIDLTTQQVKTVAALASRPRALTLATQGQLFITADNHTVTRVVLPNGKPQVLWGMPDMPGSTDGANQAALFNAPAGILFDGKSTLYVSDSGNHTLRSIDLNTGLSKTLAGQPGMVGFVDGAAAQARFNLPYALTITPAGQLLIADTRNDLVRLFDPTSQTVTTLLGRPGVIGVGLGAAPGSLSEPTGLSLLPDGRLAITSRYENAILLAD